MRLRSPALVTLGFLLAGCASSGGGGAVTDLLAKPAPAFLLTSINGQKVSLAQYIGQVVVIDFWASWCPPCRESLPHLQAVATDQRLATAGLVVLAVNERESVRDVRSFVDSSHYSFTVLRDEDGSVARNYSVSTIPTTIVVGRDGIVVSVIDEGTTESARHLDDAIASALRAGIAVP